MSPSYKVGVLTAMINEELERQGRGSQTRLAKHLGVTDQTVSKWVKGEVQPDRSRWAELEDCFGWPRGTIARKVYAEDDSSGLVFDMDEVSRLRAEVEALRHVVQRQARLQERLAEQVAALLDQ